MDFESCSSENQVTDVMLEGESTRKKKGSDFQTHTSVYMIWGRKQNE